MSYILNALKKAENKSFDGENLKIKKQILVLKRRARGGKLKVLALSTALLGTLLLGGWLGYMQKPQAENRTESAQNHPLFNNEKSAPPYNESSLNGDALISPAKTTEEMQPNNILQKSVDTQNAAKVENKMDTANPPIPVRTISDQVNAPQAEAVQQIQEQEVGKNFEGSLLNYSELPFLIKQKLPPLNISLHFYNSTPARRLVRINERILHENDSIGDKLTVEEIKPTSTVLNYDGYLFKLNVPGG